MLQKCVIEMV